MNCIEFYELVSEKIDNRLTSDQMLAFTEHAQLCHPCDVEYLMAATTKALLREKVHCIPVPSDVYVAIMHSTTGLSSLPGFQARPQ